MAILLLIETATEIGSVCISQDGQLLSLKESAEPMMHTKETTLLIEKCCKEAGITLSQIDAVAISSGPGSYTALRVGSATAKGICYALDKPLIAVPTLQALALASSKEQSGDFYHPMIDARRKEVYTAIYNNQLTEVKSCHALILEEEGFKKEDTLVFSGNGSFKFKEMTTNKRHFFTETICSAAHLIQLAEEAFRSHQFESIVYFEPTYLKPPNITVAKKKLL